MMTLLLAAGERPLLTPRQVWATAETNLLGGPSPDGRFVSFADSETGDLALRNLETGEKRRLTRNTAHGQFAYFSTISPDSRQVAYAWFNEEKFYELRVVGVDGAEPRVLYRNPEAGFVQPCAWSPDGRRILTLFFRKDNISQIALVPAAGGAPRALKSLNWVYPKKMDFSPDGQYVVYDNTARQGSGARDIFLLSVDGSREVPLVEHPADDLFPLWTPDGTAVVFASDRSGTMDAWRIRVEGGRAQGAPELLRRDLGRFLPLGITRRGAYYYGLRDGYEDVHIASLEPGAAKPGPPASRRFPGANRAPAFSPDGAWLAYFSRRGTENYGQASRVIVIQSVESGEERELSPKLALLEELGWADGRTLLVSGSDGKGRGGLYRVNARSGETSLLVLGGSTPGVAGVLSRDGRRLFYARSGIVVRDLESGEEKALYRPVAAAPRRLVLSPDGSQLAFATAATLWIVPAGGGEPREVFRLPDGDIGGLAWTPDGAFLVFAAGERLWRIPVRGGKPQDLGVETGRAAEFSLHPDGRRIAFTAGRTQSQVWVLDL